MTAAEILAELKPLGTATYKKTLMRHGIKEPCFGVKIEDMKKIVKRVGKSYQLALDLYDTGVFDAMYLAGLIADDSKMTPRDLQHWVDQAYCEALSEYTVPWVAAGSHHGWDLGMKWLDTETERIAAAGWATLGDLAAIKQDAELDIAEYEQLLERVTKTIHQEPNRVRYVMNGFVISVGSYIKPLTRHALQAASLIGPVSVDMDGTACKVPSATEYIKKIEARGAIGKKRKSAKC
jgi:3-methyladenine DNA glycosylase AlkD